MLDEKPKGRGKFARKSSSTKTTKTTAKKAGAKKTQKSTKPPVKK